jgi:alanine dehydrogenase
MPPLITPEQIIEPQLSPVEVNDSECMAIVGMLNSEDLFSPLMLSLYQIEALVEKRVAIYVQRGLGEKYEISDYQFTEYGADIMEDEFPVIALSNIVLKYEPFSIEEIFFLKEKQIIISMANPEVFTNEMVQFLHEKKITAVGVNFLDLEDFKLQNIVNQLVLAFVFSKNITHNIQLNPLFLKSVYCYNGEICNRIIAEHAGVPWKDLIELCWNWN